MAGRVGSPYGLPVPLSRFANPALARPPFGDGERFRPPTKEHHIMATHAPACARLHAPASPFRTLTLYRALRRVVGPVQAWRVAFGWRAAA